MDETKAWDEIFTNLRREIKSSRLSITEIAKRLDIPRTTLSNYYSAASAPNLYMLRRICYVLNCDYKDILGESIPND